ncbi:unnamed protein product [Protopolystoma xenopodis]|uniref:Uncharacterized protein n=1 Tax=Protopolystoma xenopodis TaxID=117903 RepID=A0A3S5AHX4_9PLAT|nr:unnamed protein product [Protopolystoma xenopodis]
MQLPPGLAKCLLEVEQLVATAPSSGGGLFLITDPYCREELAPISHLAQRLMASKYQKDDELPSDASGQSETIVMVRFVNSTPDSSSIDRIMLR